MFLIPPPPWFKRNHAWPNYDKNSVVTNKKKVSVFLVLVMILIKVEWSHYYSYTVFKIMVQLYEIFIFTGLLWLSYVSVIFPLNYYRYVTVVVIFFLYLIFILRFFGQYNCYAYFCFFGTYLVMLSWPLYHKIEWGGLRCY